VEGEKIGLQVQNHEFRDVQPLTFWRQLGTWLFWSFIGPILLGFWFASITTGETGCFRTTAGVLALPIAGYAAYVCFGSTLAVIIGLIVYVIITGFIFLLLLIFEKSMSHRSFEIALFLGFFRPKTKTFIFQSSVSGSAH
jgi:hypothetical protein